MKNESDARVALFQKKSADYIYNKLFETKRNTFKRFLLADEVGLGKTHVAGYIIKRFSKKKTGKCVIYICSNTHLARENGGKLLKECGRDKKAVEPVP